MTPDKRETRDTRWVSRRRLLQLGSTAIAVAAAGCQGDDNDDGSGDNTDGNETDDGSATNETDDGTDNDDENNSDDSNDDNNNDNDDDNNNDNDDDNNNDEEDEYASFNSEVTGFLQQPRAIVATGSIDTAEVEEWALDEDRRGLPLGESGSLGDHTIYEVTSEESNIAIGVSTESIVLGANQSKTEKLIQLLRGDQQRATEAYEEFRWLLSAAGDGEFVRGAYLPESQRDEREEDGPLRSATGYAVSMQLGDGETLTRFAGSYPDLSTELQNQIREEVGQDADERQIGFDGNRAYVEGSYGKDLIQAIGSAGEEEQVSFDNGGDPSTSEGAVPDTDAGSLPKLSEFLSVQEGLQGVPDGLVQGFWVGERTIQTVEDGSTDKLQSEDPMLTEPVERGEFLHNALGQQLLFPFPFLFRIAFDIEELNTQSESSS